MTNNHILIQLPIYVLLPPDPIDIFFTGIYSILNDLLKWSDHLANFCWQLIITWQDDKKKPSFYNPTHCQLGVERSVCNITERPSLELLDFIFLFMRLVNFSHPTNSSHCSCRLRTEHKQYIGLVLLTTPSSCSHRHPCCTVLLPRHYYPEKTQPLLNDWRYKSNNLSANESLS